jgi:hypothetical protein
MAARYSVSWRLDPRSGTVVVFCITTRNSYGDYQTTVTVSASKIIE